jgi:hypothetical protein
MHYTSGPAKQGTIIESRGEPTVSLLRLQDSQDIASQGQANSGSSLPQKHER